MLVSCSGCAILMVSTLLSDASLVSVSVFLPVLPLSCSRTVGTFKNFKLHWPESSNSFFQSVSNFLNFNPDLLSFECWVPEDVGGVHLRLQYQHKVCHHSLDDACCAMQCTVRSSARLSQSSACFCSVVVGLFLRSCLCSLLLSGPCSCRCRSSWQHCSS